MKKLFTLFLFFLLLSCGDESERIDQNQPDLQRTINLTHDEYISIAFDNPEEVNQDEIVSIVSDFLSVMQEDEATNNSTNTRSFDSTYDLSVIAKSYFIKDDISQTRSCDVYQLPYYEISVTSDLGNGVAYVSADERHAEVITYIPIKTDNEKVFMESGSAFLIEWAKASAYERVMEVEAIKELYHDATVNRISQELGIPSSEVKLENIIDRITVEGTRATPVTMPGTQIISAVYPLVPVQWNQTAPYNLSLPTPDSPATQSHVYTGCAVTAACQLLVATKPNLTIDGITMNWDYLAETKTISSSATQAKLNMLGKLHTWVYQTLDASPVYDSYGYHTGTGVLSSKSAWFYGAYLNSSIGYSAYDADNLKSSFDQSRPAFIHGQGHAWIIDGYIIAKKPFSPVSSTNTRMVMKSYDVFWHANLGWGGSQDGYYKLKLDTHVDFESGSYTFNTTALNIYPGLYTKNIAHNVTTYSW